MEIRYMRGGIMRKWRGIFRKRGGILRKEGAELCARAAGR